MGVFRFTQTRARSTRSWNPFWGCDYNCVYCRPVFRKVVAWWGRMHHCEQCLNYVPHQHPERLVRIPREKAIFVCQDGEISFADSEFVTGMLGIMNEDTRSGRVWFMQSKNPSCFEQYLPLLPENTYLATTLETNRDEGYREISGAPLPSVRFSAFRDLGWDKKIVNVEPIMDFDLETFEDWIVSVDPVAVFVGYNSKPDVVELSEPDKRKAWRLIHNLENRGLRVLKRHMRDRRVKERNYRDLLE